MKQTHFDRSLRVAVMVTVGVVVACALSGCVFLGGGSLPSKTYIMIPQPGAGAQPAPGSTLPSQ